MGLVKTQAKKVSPIRKAAQSLQEKLLADGVEVSCGIGLAQSGTGKVIAVRLETGQDQRSVPGQWLGFPTEVEVTGRVSAW